MKVLIVGSEGQLGRALSRTAPSNAEIIGYDIDTLDITNEVAIATAVTELEPQIIFNAAAYTAVDKAESEEGVALAVNATAVGYLAKAASRVGAHFAHVSTDFVFDGLSGVPYLPDTPPAPLGAYGRTKLAGEQLAGANALIVRTAWVYGPTGNNFVRTMLRLMAERSEVRVVADQIGTPTYAPGLAAALWTMAAKGIQGIHHYTDSGACSWYDFAVAIHEEALSAGLLAKEVPLIPINTKDYPTPARRPHYSVLDKTSTFAILAAPAPHWRTNLRKMMDEIRIKG